MSGTARPWGAPRSSAPADGGQALDARQRPRVADHAVDRRNGGRQWRGQERPPALALAALEVAVRRADRVLPGRELVAVHRNAHRAAGLTPLGTGGPEDLVQALPLGLTLHLVGAGDDHHPDAVGDLAITEDFGRQAEVADPAVRARADEHDIDLLAEDRLARLEVHVLERPLERPAGRRIDLVLRGRHAGRDWDAHPGVR